MTKQINEQENQIKELTETNKELMYEIDRLNQESELFSSISNVSKEFIEAHTAGNQEKLKKLLSDEMELVEREDILYVVSEDDYEWSLFNSNSELTLSDWIIQGFHFDLEENTYLVHIREFYIDKKGNSVIPPTFLNLYFKHQDDEWKIVKLSFDV